MPAAAQRVTKYPSACDPHTTAGQRHSSSQSPWQLVHLCLTLCVPCRGPPSSYSTRVVVARRSTESDQVSLCVRPTHNNWAKTQQQSVTLAVSVTLSLTASHAENQVHLAQERQVLAAAQRVTKYLSACDPHTTAGLRHSSNGQPGLQSVHLCVSLRPMQRTTKFV